MSWARIDDGFDDHPKVLALLEHEEGGAAVGLWTLCLTWAHRNTRKAGKVPGLIPASLPRRYLGPGARELAALLVKERFWEERAEGDGWLIHDFDRYLPTSETREARSEAGKRGAEARWGKRAGRDGSLPSSDGKPMASDGSVMAPDGSDGAFDAERAPGGAGTQSHPSADGNEPSGDGNLLSTLPSGDSKPMASDGSRAPARRVIPNGITPIPAPIVEPGKSSSTAAQAPPKQKRGTRIPDDFAENITPEMVAWAKERCPHVDGRLETEKFVNYWQARAGRDACKLDWVKTWKNRMLDLEQQASRASPNGRRPAVDPRDEWKVNRA